MTDDLLTTAEVAEMLKCSVRTVNNYVTRGHFPNARKMDPTRENSPLRIPRADVLAFQESQRVKPFRPAAVLQPKAHKKRDMEGHQQEG